MGNKEDIVKRLKAKLAIKDNDKKQKALDKSIATLHKMNGSGVADGFINYLENMKQSIPKGKTPKAQINSSESESSDTSQKPLPNEKYTEYFDSTVISDLDKIFFDIKGYSLLKEAEKFEAELSGDSSGSDSE